MATIIKITCIGRVLNSKSPAKGVNGKQRVRTTMSIVATSRYLSGLLLNKGFLPFITMTIIDA
jgi:hypothetical protein